MKNYLSERNALTVVACLFCLVMMIVAILIRQSIWEAVAFALAFSFSIEVLCHRAKETR
jgi:predicted signal transduction protein with EAL and GGDEF domain